MEHIDIYLEKKIHETDLYIQELALRKELGGRDKLILYSHFCLMLLYKYANPEENFATLNCNLDVVMKTVYTTCKNNTELLSDLHALITTYIYGIHQSNILVSKNAVARRTLFAECQSLALLTDELINTNIIKYVSNDEEREIIRLLTEMMAENVKYIGVYNHTELASQFVDNIDMHIGVCQSDMQLSSSRTSIAMVRKKTIGEFFDYDLESVGKNKAKELCIEIID